jgi:hypothetical protein
MGEVTGFTASQTQALIDGMLASGEVDEDGHLIFTLGDGTTQDAGSVAGPPGPTGPSVTLPMVHTWTVSGPVYVPSAGFGFIPPMAVSVPSGVNIVLRAIRYGLRAGTSATFSFRKNGVAVTSLNACVAGVTRLTTAANGGTPVALADLDELAPVVTGIVGNPDGLFVSMFLDVTR